MPDTPQTIGRRAPKPLLDITPADITAMTKLELKGISRAAHSAWHRLEYSRGILSYEDGRRASALLSLYYKIGNELSDRADRESEAAKRNAA